MRPSAARSAWSTATSRRGSTRSATLRNPSRLTRAAPSALPPQANGGTYLGGRTASNTFAPAPITVPAPSRVPIAVLAWSPIRVPRNCIPVSTAVPATSSRTVPYVFFRFDVIVPAPRFTQRPITEWPTNPSCALFAYPRNTQLDTSPRTLEARAGPDLDAALQHHRPVAHVEHDAGLDGGIVQRDPRGIAQDGAARGNRVALAQQPDQIFAQQRLERPDHVVHPVQHDSGHLVRRGVRLRSVPGGARPDPPSHRHPATRQPERPPPLGERRREPARCKGRRAKERRSGNGVAGRHGGDARLREPCQVGEREDLRDLRAQERLPPLAHEVRSDPQLGQRAHARERRPAGRGIGVEQIERGRHGRCTSARRCSARPVGITRVWPLARTTTMSSSPITARCSLSDQITERRTSS